jgi:ribosomal-protein-serine acetyltransferase
MKNREIYIDNQLFLKEIEVEDAETIFDIIISEREYLAEWLPFIELTNDISFTRNFIEDYLNTDRLNVTFSIIYGNKIVGIVGLKDTDLDNKKTEIGYWLSEKFQHLGIMTRSCKALINYAFTNLNLNRIQIKVATDNSKSLRIPKRLGFVSEGTERDGELHVRGFVDLLIFSLLKKDFKD